MSRSSAPALRGTLLGTLLRLLNPFMRWLLQSPVHWPLSRWFAVLAWKGRKSGRDYSTPVSFVRDGSTAYVTTGDRWWRNLTGGAPVRMRVSGRWRAANAVPVTDEEQSRIDHERLFRENWWFRVLAGIPTGEGGGPDPAAVKRSIAAGRVLVRIEGLD
ncbi:MAG TPA: nitroreductase/quinone reductase family protein [Candidatus Limnocylindria bacterium]|nr:nitroreductase/quinone reductase family protein [Candidatus Limnocylindria bacterium]